MGRLYTIGKILHEMMLRDLYRSTADQWFKEQVQVTHAMTFELVVIALNLVWLSHSAYASYFNQLLETFIKAY